MSTHSRQRGLRKGLAVMLAPRHLPLALVRAIGCQAPMLLASGHEDLYASALLSPSLSSADKARVLDKGPTLSQYQADELAIVFKDEREAFAKLIFTECREVARLQAHALWDGLELARERLEIGPALRNAWLRRTVRQAARGGALAKWLRTALPKASDWNRAGTIERRVYREALPADHPAWNPDDDDTALAKAAAARRHEQAAALAGKSQQAADEARTRAEQAAEASWAD